MKVWLRDIVKVGVKFDKWVNFGVPQKVLFLDERGQNRFSNHEQVIIGQHKSIPHICHFCHYIFLRDGFKRKYSNLFHMSKHANMLKPLCVWFGRVMQLKWLSKAAWDPIVNVIAQWSRRGGVRLFCTKKFGIHFFAWLVLFIHISFRKITFCNINSFMINKTRLQKSSSASGSSGKVEESEESKQAGSRPGRACHTLHSHQSKLIVVLL